MGQTALVVIDVQVGLVEQVHGAQALLQQIAGLLEKARAAGVPVVFVQDDDVSEPGSDAWQVHPEVAPLPTERRIRKKATDAFFQTDLHTYLTANRVTDLVICGCKTNYCIDTAVRRATTLGYQVIVAQDAHSTTDNGVLSAEQIIAHHNATLHGLDNVHNYSLVTPCAEITFDTPEQQPHGAVREGERVYIRSFAACHAQEYADLMRRNREFWGAHEVQRDDDEYTVEYQQVGIENMCAAWVKDQGYFFGIFLKETDELIGDIGVHEIKRGPYQSAFVGYSLDQAHNGKGYMTEALQLVINFSFQELNLHRLQAGVAPANPASYRVLEKVGFERQGVERKNMLIAGQWADHWLYDLLNEQWEG
ncbi:isochorismatase family protein [Tumebacillus algifaecis]|uniref:isochorismatase family protein n=1 Tax=Tumebacillus algifaecis TaxID=1214604 RepID=UPI001D131591|nr:isochorismatase family protein [Tumebacillus algifaecis]